MFFLKSFLIFLVGLALGSFANVLVDRGQKKKSLMGSSKCDFCGCKLKWFDNIPLLSFFLLWGKCRQCGKKLSWQYPIVEFLMGLVFLWVAKGAGFLNGIAIEKEWIEASYLLVISFVLVVIFFWDLKYMVIPDGLILGGFLVSLVYSIYHYWFSFCSLWDIDCFLASNVGGGLLVGGFFYILYSFSGGRWIGGGDVKLGAWIGFMIGWQFAYTFLLIAYVTGAIVAVFLLVTGKKKTSSKIPFGPFLVLAALVVLLYGDSLMGFYDYLTNSLFF